MKWTATFFLGQLISDVLAGSFFSITVEPNPRVLGDSGDIKARDVQEAVDFVQRNQTPLLAVWYQELGVDEVSWSQ